MNESKTLRIVFKIQKYKKNTRKAVRFRHVPFKIMEIFSTL